MVTEQEVREALEVLKGQIVDGSGAVLLNHTGYGTINSQIGEVGIEHTLDTQSREEVMNKRAKRSYEIIVKGYVEYEVDGEEYYTGNDHSELDPKFYTVDEFREAINDLGGKVTHFEETSDEEFYEFINDEYSPLAEETIELAAADDILINKLANAINESGVEIEGDLEYEVARLIGVESTWE